MKNVISTISTILLAAISVYAQQPINIQIPFAFHVGRTVLPAGTYTTDVSAGTGVLRMRSDDGKANVIALSNRVLSNRPSQDSKLVFHKYGDQYFLYQYWSAGSASGTEMLKSQSEKTVAASMRRDSETIIARR